MHAKSQGSYERAGLPVNYEMEIPDNEMEDNTDEMLDPKNDVTDGEGSDSDVGDMPNHDTSVREKETRLSPIVRSRHESHIRLCGICL
jgi:hypothetical protein